VKNRNPKLHLLEEPADAGELLANRYGQLLRWATVLTRGNASKAEEIVQEFCVYIAVAKPESIRNQSGTDGNDHNVTVSVTTTDRGHFR
jgi:DNA-directed RNA polymerase specialized sigma24 family protein